MFLLSCRLVITEITWEISVLLSVLEIVIIKMMKHCFNGYSDETRRSQRHLSSSLSVSVSELDHHNGLDGHSNSCVSLHVSSQSSSESEENSVCPVDVGYLSLGNTIRVHASCLRPHLTYKTIKIHNHTTSRQIISSLLARFRMRHMDYKLYYLTMEVYVNNALQTITLDDNSRPAELISCNPWHVECKFILKSKTGGRVKIYDDQIRPDSVYKSIIISRETTVGDSLAILHNCYPHPMLDSQARD